ncbi:MAG: hypothetical protein NUV67_03320, partial [archaeon]|nr:hypothetical protein [archaeon]
KISPSQKRLISKALPLVLGANVKERQLEETTGLVNRIVPLVCEELKTQLNDFSKQDRHTLEQLFDFLAKNPHSFALNEPPLSVRKIGRHLSEDAAKNIESIIFRQQDLFARINNQKRSNSPDLEFHDALEFRVAHDLHFSLYEALAFLRLCRK